MDFNIARLLIGQQGLTSHSVLPHRRFSVLARRFIPDSFGFSLGLHSVHSGLHSVPSAKPSSSQNKKARCGIRNQISLFH
jgi:hypothetical protein